MVSFIARRILVSVLILIAASFIMYNLAAIAGNPPAGPPTEQLAEP
ncbi:hypothetical protein GCM10009769_15600 [Curtobacterium luteum]|uniref:Uncharacterized protein n=1 Tax=Curtobacterium luteum TaxID=33881 RepID=A0A8H9G9E6_9MICO|nr:hypothetical protein [Curtobacterium luteum]GGK98259.1 hypothetical protein GCM10009769_15600 [Curtobacterium luteum]